MTRRTKSVRVALGTLGLVAASTIVLTGCSGGGSTTTPTSTTRGALVVGVTTDVKTLVPWTATAFHDVYDVLPQLYDTLVGFDDQLNVVPALAEKWTVSDDGLTYTFDLRQGVKFSDGSDLDAQDVVDSYDTIKDPATKAAAAANLGGVASVTATDASTVTIVLSAPDAAFLSKLAPVTMAILPSGADLTKLATTPDGTGPFTLTSDTANQSMTLTANDDYWGGEPTLASVEFRVIPDNASIAAAMQSGNVQFAVFPDSVTAQTAGTGTDVLKENQLSYSALMLNADKAGSVVADVNVRLAIQCAIDRDEVVQSAALGDGTVTGPITSPAFASDPSDRPCPTQDLDKAKDYLAKAGYANGLTIKTLAPTAAVYAQGPAEATDLQAQLAKVGITLDLVTEDTTAYVNDWLAGTYDAAVARNGGQPDPDAMYNRYFISTGNLNKVAGYSSPELDQLFAEGKATTDLSQRQAIYKQISEQLEDNAAWVWLYTPISYTVTANGVSGFTPMPNGSLQGLRSTSYAG